MPVPGQQISKPRAIVIPSKQKVIGTQAVKSDKQRNTVAPNVNSSKRAIGNLRQSTKKTSTITATAKNVSR